jgi:hypothetical protein
VGLQARILCSNLFSLIHQPVQLLAHFTHGLCLSAESLFESTQSVAELINTC